MTFEINLMSLGFLLLSFSYIVVGFILFLWEDETPEEKYIYQEPISTPVLIEKDAGLIVRKVTVCGYCDAPIEGGKDNDPCKYCGH